MLIQRSASVEVLDVLRLSQYLDGRLDGFHGTLVVEKFTRGMSNLTFLLRSGDKEYVLRRPANVPIDGSISGVGREYRLLARLSAVFPKAPRPLLQCEDRTILGAPFFVMQRIKGVTLRAEIRNGAALSPTRMRCASEVLADTLAELHGVDVAKAGLLEIGRGQNYLPRQVQAWGNRYEKARTESSPDLDDLTAWLLTRIPKRSETTLVHNDYKYDNVFLDASTFGTVVAIIDWERATLGDPVLDLGIALGSWVQGDDPPEFRALQEGPTYLPGSLTRTEFAQRYAERSRRRIDHLHYCFVFALYQRAVAAQQRLAKVLATPEPGVDPRAVNHQVKILARLAAKSAISGRVDQLAL